MVGAPIVLWKIYRVYEISQQQTGERVLFLGGYQISYYAPDIETHKRYKMYSLKIG
jgi:hypothetical protein